MEKNCRFSYNEIDDSLIISCKEENEKVANSFMFDEFIFNLTRKGKIVGIQIRNASKILAENNISSNLLNEIKSASLIIARRENCLFISLSIASNNIKVNVPLRVFIPEMPLTA